MSEAYFRTCNYCKNQFADNLKQCSHCGARIKKQPPNSVLDKTRKGAEKKAAERVVNDAEYKKRVVKGIQKHAQGRQ